MATLDHARPSTATSPTLVLKGPRAHWIGETSLLALYYLGLLSGRFTLERLGTRLEPTSTLSQVSLWFLGVIIFGLAIRWSVWGHARPRNSLQTKWLGAVVIFHAYIALSILWAPRPDRSLPRLWELAIVIAYILIAPAVLAEDSTFAIDLTFKFWFWTAVVYAAAGLYGIWWSWGRMAAFGGGPNVFGRVIATGIFASLYLWAVKGNLRWFLALPFLIPCLIASGSRGGVVALAVTLPFALMAILRTSGRIRGLIVGGAFTTLILSQWLWETFADVWRFRFVELTFERRYVADRDILFEDAWRIFLENKWFGAGLDGYSQTTGSSYPHNLVLQVLAEGGLVGIVLLVVILCFLLRRFTFPRKLGHIAAFWCGTFYFVASLFSGTYLDARNIWIFYFMFLNSARSTAALSSRRDRPARDSVIGFRKEASLIRRS